MKLHPLSWKFSSCPPEEIRYLFCYELSRELQWIRATVDLIRHGYMERQSYWSPIKDFGWKEWPERPYLWLPPAERKERLARLFALGKGPFVDDQVKSVTQEDYTRALENRLHLAEHQSPIKMVRSGRSALGARYHDRLRMLSIYRLRQHHSPKEVYEALRSHYRKIAYNSPKNISRTLHTFDRHLCEFYLKAKSNIDRGLWFPPFGRYLIEP